MTLRSKGWSYFDVAEETIRIGLLFDLMRKASDEDVYELTDKGSTYLNSWCEEQIAIARCWAC